MGSGKRQARNASRSTRAAKRQPDTNTSTDTGTSTSTRALGLPEPPNFPTARSYDEATLAVYFRGARPAIFDDPVAGPELRRLAIQDPDILAAVADVDRTQILIATLDEQMRRKE